MSYRQEVTFAATPEAVFDVLTDSAKFAAATEQPARIGAKAGEAFELFGGRIVGRQIEVSPGEEIVQAWRFPDWAPGVYSLVRLQLSGHQDGAKLILDHDAIPEGVSPIFPTWEEHIAAGWPMFYFSPMQNYLSAQH